jgi:hypothetical protein
MDNIRTRISQPSRTQRGSPSPAGHVYPASWRALDPTPEIPKLRVAGSNPVSRSKFLGRNSWAFARRVPAFVFPGAGSGSNRVANSSASGRGPPLLARPAPVRPERSAREAGAESKRAAAGTVSSTAAPNDSRSTSARRYSGARCA